MENQYIVFKLFNQYCFLPLETVVEVCSINVLVKTKAKELNVMMWRNHPIPVVDPTAMMTRLNKEQEVTTQSKLLVVKPREDAREFAIMVDMVIGVEEILADDIEEAHINDARYINGRVSRKTHQLKMIDLNELLKTNILDKFPIIYSMKTEELDKGVKLFGKLPSGKDEVIDSMRLKAINWLIRANKRNIEESFMVDMKKIYDLTLKL